MHSYFTQTAADDALVLGNANSLKQLVNSRHAKMTRCVDKFLLPSRILFFRVSRLTFGQLYDLLNAIDVIYAVVEEHYCRVQGTLANFFVAT
jgi:hypothetical protein